MGFPLGDSRGRMQMPREQSCKARHDYARGSADAPAEITGCGPAPLSARRTIGGDGTGVPEDRIAHGVARPRRIRSARSPIAFGEFVRPVLVRVRAVHAYSCSN